MLVLTILVATGNEQHNLLRRNPCKFIMILLQRNQLEYHGWSWHILAMLILRCYFEVFALPCFPIWNITFSNMCMEWNWMVFHDLETWRLSKLHSRRNVTLKLAIPTGRRTVAFQNHCKVGGFNWWCSISFMGWLPKSSDTCTIFWKRCRVEVASSPHEFQWNLKIPPNYHDCDGKQSTKAWNSKLDQFVETEVLNNL